MNVKASSEKQVTAVVSVEWSKGVSVGAPADHKGTIADEDIKSCIESCQNDAEHLAAKNISICPVSKDVGSEVTSDSSNGMILSVISMVDLTALTCTTYDASEKTVKDKKPTAKGVPSEGKASNEVETVETVQSQNKDVSHLKASGMTSVFTMGSVARSNQAAEQTGGVVVFVEVEVFVVEQGDYPIQSPRRKTITVSEKAIVTTEETKVTLASESLESAYETEDAPGALVVVVAVVVLAVGVVVVVEEKIEPDAASIGPGDQKTKATKVACETINSGSVEVKVKAEGTFRVTKEQALKDEVEESKKKSEEAGVLAESKQLISI